MKFTYYHPPVGQDGRRLSSGNIIWADRDRGSSYYRVSGYAMKAGKFPPIHPCAPFDDEAPKNSAQIGGSKQLTAFRGRGYWASCFPEGDGITLQWDENAEKTAEQVMQDIRECFGWEVEQDK